MSDMSRARIALFGVTGLAYAVALPLAPVAGMKTDLSGLLVPSLVEVASMAGASYLCSRLGAFRLRTWIESYFLGLLLLLPEALSVYMAAHLQMPWADAQLDAIDHALGWDWKTTMTWIDSSALLSKTLTFAYFSFGFQLLILPVVLCLSGKAARVYQMVVMSAVMCFVSGLVSIWYPAVGTYVFYDIDLTTLKNLGAYAPTVFMDQLVSVHDDPDFVFSLASVKGIVTFPSMHAAIAVLCSWAAWESRPIRYPVLALNILMGFSAAIVANHYLADIIGGIGVAGISISAVLLLVREQRLWSFSRPGQRIFADRKPGNPATGR